MRITFKNAFCAFFLLLFAAVFTSCQKDHDLVSSYVIQGAAKEAIAAKTEVGDSGNTIKIESREFLEEPKPKSSK